MILATVSAAFALALIACGSDGTADETPDPAAMAAATVDVDLPLGHRRWVITVENQSAALARLMVAEDEVRIGDLVGTARPANVPPGMTIDVTFVVPPGDGWAIFVNPSARRGPLLLSMDVPPDFSGKLPVEFLVRPGGDPQMSHAGDLGPGWFGE